MKSGFAMRDGISRGRWITHTGFFLALAILLPIGFHALGIAGRLFLPMHIPILLAGFLVGSSSGLLAGLLAPSLSYLITGMPPVYSIPLMSLELSVYGLIAGLAYVRLHLNIYLALLTAMLVGRIMFGAGLLVLGLFIDLPYSATVFFSAAGPLVTGLPGIVLQIFLIPLIVAASKRKSV